MGRKTKYLTERKNVAAIGIGAMIVFIAMVLVAGIAASVLVQTSTTLEMQALRTGSQTVEAVASGIMIQGIEGYAATDQGISLLALEIRPRAGSPDIDLSEVVIEISDSETKFVLEYGDSLTASNDTLGNVFTPGFYPSGGDENTEFYIIVLQDADGSCTQDNPIINYGDHVILAIGNAFGGIWPRTNVFGQIISEEGAPGIIGFRTPESYTVTIMELQ